MATEENMRNFKKTSERQWYVYDNFGEKVYPGTDRGRNLSRLDAFRIMFPSDQMKLMLDLTNNELRKKRRAVPLMTEGEMLKFFGILVLMTRVRCRNRKDCWGTRSKYKYQPTVNFAETGMTRHRWDDIWSAIRFSHQPEEKPPEMSNADWRWMLIDDFVKNFNDHRANSYYPSDKICVDESIIRWYGVGGDWINMGLPFYVALERKPENGCEVQNACDGKSGIMMRLKIVKKPETEALYVAAQTQATPSVEDLGHGTEVLLELLHPWKKARGQRRCVAADSYFASVQAATKMLEEGFDFLGPVKTCHREFPKQFLEGLEIPPGRGHTRSLVSDDDDGRIALIATMWVDRDRKFFIGTCEGSDPGNPQYRMRWRQLDDVETNATPVRLMLEVPQPRMVESYFGFCSRIDELNRQRQTDLEMEKYVRTNDFSKRLGTSILSMCMVDAMNLHQQCKPYAETDCNSHEWFSLFAEELIDNDIDGIGATTRSQRRSSGDTTTSPTPNARSIPTNLGLTPNKERDRRGFTKQGRCKICNIKATTMCRTCTEDDDHKRPFWLCSTRSKRNCWNDHKSEKHN